MEPPTQDEFRRGIDAFEKRERRDSMYRVATFLVSHFWGKPADMADGLGTLLLTWNQAFYRYGAFDFDKLEECLEGNLTRLESFRRRDISSLSNADEEDIKGLFSQLLEALEIPSGNKQGSRSPVAVAKALHLLAPHFFPIWDQRIARAYRCYYSVNPSAAYVLFCNIMKDIADLVCHYVPQPDRSVLKLIDEYNYSKYTQKWI